MTPEKRHFQYTPWSNLPWLAVQNLSNNISQKWTAKQQHSSIPRSLRRVHLFLRPIIKHPFRLRLPALLIIKIAFRRRGIACSSHLPFKSEVRLHRELKLLSSKGFAGEGARSDPQELGENRNGERADEVLVPFTAFSTSIVLISEGQVSRIETERI